MVNIIVFILKKRNVECVSVYQKLTALFESRHLDTATVSWVLIATALASCTMGVTPAIRNSITVNSAKSTKYLYTEGSSFNHINSLAKIKILTLVLLRIQVL
jgi:hypothetical protein